MSAKVIVFGPAYLDRVLRVDRRLIERDLGPPLDQSVEGACGFGADQNLQLIEPSGSVLEITLPETWPGPFGQVVLASELRPVAKARRLVQGLSWSDDLGGMGAGYAAALGGMLHHALGSEDDPGSRAVAELLAREGVVHEPIRIRDRPADWTLLVTSGAYGDKLAIGFRGCHAALAEDAFDSWLPAPCDLRVVAGLPNPLAARLLSAPGARCRLFAPAMRNMLDRACPVSAFAGSIDLLCCNRHEWETLPDREETAWKLSILVVTDGPAGAWARFTVPSGDPGRLQVPAFPRARPPADTNRAGEAFAATFASALLSHGWDPASGVAEPGLIQQAMLRASAAAALVLDRTDFGFPRPEEIDAALHAGRVL